MDAKSESFTFLSNAGSVEIPFFQRGYVWNKDNWEDLLEDLLDSDKAPFLGSLILKQQPTSTGAVRNTMVIDGQQRLSSLSILVKALYDTFPVQDRADLLYAVRNTLFYKKQPADKHFLIKITHSRLDKEAYDQVISNGIDNDNETGIQSSSNNKILSCYNYFKEKLMNKSEEIRLGLFNKILNQDNKMLVVIDLTSDDNEQAIFDTINSAGVRLTCSDIVKNALFQRAIQLTKDRSDAIELYKNTWEKVFLADEDAISFWEKQGFTGRLSRDNLEILLHSVAIIKGFFDPDRHTLSDLSKLYKEQIDSFSTMNELGPFIEDLKEYANIFRQRIPVFGSDKLFSFGDRNLRLFHILDVLQISTFHPLVLYLFKDCPGEKREHLLSCLERFVMRRMISNQETRSYNKLCRDFIRDPDSLIEATKKTTDEQIKEGLKSIGNKNASLLLFWIELQRRQDPKTDEKDLKYTYSLEHLMPQNWEEHWKQMPEKKNEDGSIMSDEEAKQDRYAKIYWLGNMTLLTSNLNSALRNFSFTKKMEGEGRKKGIKDYASLYITLDDVVRPYESGDVVWDEEKIMSRNSKLTEEILKIWG